MSAAEENALREMRYLKRNARKAVDEAIRKSKLDEGLWDMEMMALRGEIEPLLTQLDESVKIYLELVTGRGKRPG